MSRWLNRLQPWGIFLIRLVLGVSMTYHGYPKVVPAGGFHGGNTFSALDHFGHSIAKLGMPYWLGYVSAFTEFAGGIFLIFGALTRFVAFLVAINMIVAIVTVDVHKGYTGSEYPLALAAMALMLLFAGSGAVAIDRKLGLL